MIQAGFTFESFQTHTRTIVLKSEAETQGLGWELELHTQPGNGPEIPEHLHLTWTERFEIISGTAAYKLDGVKRTAEAGQAFVVEPGHTHVHPWNAGQTEMVYRQIDTFQKSSPRAVQDVVGVFATLNGLSREGKTDSHGRLKNPLHMAVVLKTLTHYDGYDASLSIPAQKFIAATLGRLGAALGYRAVEDRFINQ